MREIAIEKMGLSEAPPKPAKSPKAEAEAGKRKGAGESAKAGAS
jgi:hypothetical protein